MSETKHLGTMPAQGKYADWKRECMQNGGTYMATTGALQPKELFMMIYKLHDRYVDQIEVHYPENMYNLVVPILALLGSTFSILQIRVDRIVVSDDLIPYQVFIMPKKGWVAMGDNSTVYVIEPIDETVYKK